MVFSPKHPPTLTEALSLFSRTKNSRGWICKNPCTLNVPAEAEFFEAEDADKEGQ